VVHDYEKQGPSIAQLFESPLAKLWEHTPTGMSNRSHNITGVNMLVRHTDFDRDDARKRKLEICPSMQLSI